MTEWTVVGVLISLIGLIAVVVKPMLNLNASITRLTTLLDNVTRELQMITDKNAKGHDRIWHKLTEQDGVLGLHEHRLTVLEEHQKESGYKEAT